MSLRSRRTSRLVANLKINPALGARVSGGPGLVTFRENRQALSRCEGSGTSGKPWGRSTNSPSRKPKSWISNGCGSERGPRSGFGPRLQGPPLRFAGDWPIRIRAGSWPSLARALQDLHKFGFPYEALVFSDIDSPQQRQTRGFIAFDASPLRGGLDIEIAHLDQGGGQVLDESQSLVFLQFAARDVLRHERSADNSSIGLFNRRYNQ